MRFFVVLTVCILFGPSAVDAQQESANEIASRMNRMVATLRVARVEASNASSELEIVEEQSKQIAALTVDYKVMLQEYNDFINDNNQEAALSLVTSNLPQFENKLKSDILLPNQSELLTKLVFTEMLEVAGGNLLKAISTFYANEFRLTDQQSEKLSKIDARVAKEVAEAKRTFDEEIKRIAKAARADAEKILSPDQIETLKRFSNTPWPR